MLAEHGTQCGLGQLANVFEITLNLDNRLFRVNHAKIDDCVDLDGNIIFRNDILGRHVHDNDPKIDPLYLLDYRDHDDQPRAFHFPETPELENDPALVFTQDLDGIDDDADAEEEEDDKIAA